ncbi:unnamed protein product [Cunninghamella echinulata]
MIMKRNMTSQAIQKNETSIETKPNTGLIAGLTSGLVIFALIALTAGGFIIYRKRKRSKEHIIKKFNISNDTDLNFPSPPTGSLTSLPFPPHKVITIPPVSVTTNSLKGYDPLGVPSMITTTNHQTLLNDEKDNLTPHYHGSALHIPPLITTPTTINTPTFIDENPRLINNDNNSNNTIQRSLTLNFQSRRPSHQQLSTNSNPIPSATSLNRSASVKVTKYDYPSSTAAMTTTAYYDDDDLDHIQIKRAVSVKRNRNNNQLLKPTITTISRSNSVKSQRRSSLNNDPKRKIEEEEEEEEKGEEEKEEEKENREKKEKDDTESLNETINSTAGSDTIQIVTLKPTIARIRSLSRKEKQKQIPEVENEQAEQVEQPDVNKVNEDEKQQQQSLQPHHHHERISMPVSTHSTLADGEITVYWQP